MQKSAKSANKSGKKVFSEYEIFIYRKIFIKMHNFLHCLHLAGGSFKQILHLFFFVLFTLSPPYLIHQAELGLLTPWG